MKKEIIVCTALNRFRIIAKTECGQAPFSVVSLSLLDKPLLPCQHRATLSFFRKATAMLRISETSSSSWLCFLRKTTRPHGLFRTLERWMTMRIHTIQLLLIMVKQYIHRQAFRLASARLQLFCRWETRKHLHSMLKNIPRHCRPHIKWLFRTKQTCTRRGVIITIRGCFSCK